MKRVQRYMMRKRMIRRWYAVILAFIVIFLAGFLVVDYNTAWIIEGHGRIRAISIDISNRYINIDLLGNNIKIPL
ncbi:hypothetical protein SAMN02746089_00038 [Caldanaerobius fijiensis DSM 17918]|uniref:Uncharacterized protein n=1 Tax=Caldanaerobius fijiensis DSM 17918 TaxID=1121256 RepID=A0A1M4SG46_9THEO|nr:hypothetical protein [Caldanaerobius fijiensis]SHE31181.1 hypothetical protein SAMN02746089_00038 [Caldanaerobius fijiensis DSM 17918]